MKKKINSWNMSLCVRWIYIMWVFSFHVPSVPVPDLMVGDLCSSMHCKYLHYNMYVFGDFQFSEHGGRAQCFPTSIEARHPCYMRKISQNTYVTNSTNIETTISSQFTFMHYFLSPLLFDHLHYPSLVCPGWLSKCDDLHHGSNIISGCC